MRRWLALGLAVGIFAMTGCDVEPDPPKVREMTEADYRYLQTKRVKDPNSERAKRLLDQRDFAQAQIKEARDRQREAQAEKIKKMPPEQRKRYEQMIEARREREGL